MTCRHCNDGGGGCAFPYYGLAPHKSHIKHIAGGDTVEMTIKRTGLPRNFVPDPEDETKTAGTYTHCLYCGDGMKPAERKSTVGELAFDFITPHAEVIEWLTQQSKRGM